MVRKAEVAHEAMLLPEGAGAGLVDVVDAHYGAMHRFARLADRDPGRDGGATAVVQRAWVLAAQDPGAQPPGTSQRGWMLRLVLDQLAIPVMPDTDRGAQSASSDDFEPPGSRWAGWWKDDLPATPDADVAALEGALRTLPPGLTAMLVLLDVERLGGSEVEALLGLTRQQQLVLLHRARTSLRAALRNRPTPSTRGWR